MKTILEVLQRKWAEYILEILVIIIGILGAFALDNWNEERNEREEGKEYIRSIYFDLVSDSLNLHSVLEILDLQYHSAIQVLEMLDPKYNGELDSISLNESIRACYALVYVERKRNTWDELKETGLWQIVNDDMLTNLLNNLYSEYDTSIDHFNQIPLKARERLRDFNSQVWSAIEIKSLRENRDLMFSTYLNAFWSADRLIKYLSNPDLTQMISSVGTTSAVQHERFIRLKGQLLDVLSYLENIYPDLLGIK